MREVFIKYANMPRKIVGSPTVDKAEAKKIGVLAAGRKHTIRERQATSCKMRKVKLTLAEHA